MNETSFQLKRMLRATQEREPDGSCSEAIVTIYLFDTSDFLKSASSSVMHSDRSRLAVEGRSCIHQVHRHRPGDAAGKGQSGSLHRRGELAQ